MRRSIPLEALVFGTIFPFPGAHSNPASWRHFVKKRLEPEVRAERERFYGPSEAHETIEGKYPGFDYTYWPHRRRLERWAHHKLFFNAIDQLGLSAHEIRSLCCWEGTLAEKERYERKHRIKIQDTTGDSAHHRMLCQQRSPSHSKCSECIPKPKPNHTTTTTVSSRRIDSQSAVRETLFAHTSAVPQVSMPVATNSTPHFANLGPAESARLSHAQDTYEAAFEHSDETASMEPDFDMWLKDHEAEEAVQSENPPFWHLSATLPDQISWEATL